MKKTIAIVVIAIAATIASPTVLAQDQAERIEQLEQQVRDLQRQNRGQPMSPAMRQLGAVAHSSK